MPLLPCINWLNQSAVDKHIMADDVRQYHNISFMSLKFRKRNYIYVYVHNVCVCGEIIELCGNKSSRWCKSKSAVIRFANGIFEIH